MSIKKSFKLNRVAVAVMLATAAVPQIANAGAGFGDTTNLTTNPNGKMQTYYANSPTGIFNSTACFDAVGGVAAPAALGLCDSGTELKKFVDTLPGLTAAGANNLHNYIPVAVPDTTSYADADYYEIAVVEYSQQMHTSLPASKLRGYVQIDPAATDLAGSVTRPANLPAAVSPTGSKPVALVNLDGTPAMISRPDSTSPTGFKLVQAYGVDTPHYLGPVISATQGRPTRLTFYNALPVGRADAAGRHGDIFLPVDETLPGAGFGPEGLVKYTQNRALIHLHGGDNPWISDGGPHQWITPAGELDPANSASVTAEAVAAKVSPLPFQRGPGAVNVPDMADPGPGAMTYYYPNGMSSRMEWYHDHSFGLTRLNVYAGEASAYLVRDAKEAVMTATNGALAGVPEIVLVIQDKTIVPKNIAQQDAKWDDKLWGSYGDFWYPHVYETNQDPGSADATNPVGRWDWGPWFWPVFPSTMDLPTGEHTIYPTVIDPVTGFASTPARKSWTNIDTGGVLDGPSILGMTEVTVTPEAFNDTPMVNGVIYPTMTVDPQAYRLRFLNASNDRQMNLGFYVAAIDSTVDPLNPFVNATDATKAPLLCDGTEPAGSNCSEVRMVPFSSPNGPTATTFACPTNNGMTPTSTLYPLSFPCAGGNMGTGWGSADNRPGGVPDPTTAGPNIHLMGNEAGFLAAPVDIPSTPINYEYNKRSVTVLNVLEHGLFLSTAGRADTVVDFSAFAGKTLILYNDNPAPMPAGDPRLDYYTGVGDQTGAGGADNTLPGYGPNTRTVMQVKVNAAAAPVTPFNFAKLDKAITDNVAAGQQEPPIVPQMAYSPSFGTAAPYNTDTFGNIFTGAIYLGNYKPITFTTTTSTLYTPAPGSVTKCGTPALCNAQLTAIKAAGPVLVPAGTKISAYLENKTIQELFDSTWGRMNATLGTELPFVNVNIATTIPLGYVDPATEALADGETQFWKITHNGVDSHPVHFHLVNVQVINRMGWDGTVKAPYPEDIGWKETLIMNPLEDVLVAVRSKKPVAPFALPHSYRAMDPSQPMGAMGGFTQIDPVTGNPKVVANAMDDFMNEYVWHCHILGHEENDFMRPIKFDSKDQTPDAPTIGTALAVAGGVEVKWTDPTPVGNVTTPGNPKNEFGFRVERAQVINAVTGAFAAVGKTTAYTQLTPPATRVINTLANATSYIDATASAPLAPTAGTLNSVVLNAAGTSATLSFSGATNQSSISIVRNGVTIKTGLAAGTTSYVDSTVTGLNVTYTYQVVAVAADNTYSYRVIGVNAAGETTSTKSAQAVLAGSSVLSNSVAVTTPSVSLAAATGLAAQVVSQTPTGGGNLTGLTFQLNWTDASTGETGYKVEVCHGSATQCTAASATATPIGTTANLWYPVPAGLITSTPPAAATGGQYVATVGTLPATNTRYYFRVSPLSGVTAGPVSNISAAINLNNTPAAPTGVTAASNAAGQLTVSWTDAANSNQATQVQYALARTLSTLTINNPGRGYTSAPTVTIVPNAADAGRIAIPATATATLGTGATAGRVVGLTITNPGAGYTQAPTVVFSGGTPTTAANATANITGNPNYTTVPAGANGVATSQTISGLTSGKAYLFRAAAVGVSGSGGNSATATNNGLPVVVK